MSPTTTWHHYSIEFTHPATARQTAARELAPPLQDAHLRGELRTWWYLRKTPGWRLRCQPARPDTTLVDTVLTDLAVRDLVANWSRGIYEPETLAFGGPAGMDIAHALFHRDSHHLLSQPDPSPGSPALGQRETTVLLFSQMLRAAGLDWFEQGDVWAKVAALRPPHPTTGQRAEQLASAAHRLLTANPLAVPDLIPPTWCAAFTTAGQHLGSLARTGQLQRGLRAVLAHHFLFQANRAGLPATDQALLAALAIDTIFHATPSALAPIGANTHTPKVSAMSTTANDTADDLRARLADRLRENGTVRTSTIDAALRQVPRDLFLPDSSLPDAYADAAVYTKQDGDGASISAASQPTIVAMMLEQLQVEPGDRVLEIGTGTGYNAALLATLAEASGHITTIDVDEDLTDAARGHLAAAGITTVDVVQADGALGHPAAAPFDRIIATVGAYEVPTAWLQQLAPGGRLVVPVRLAGAASRSLILERGPDGWASPGSEVAVFMPLRGIGDDARHVIDLTGSGDVTLQTHQDNTHATHPAALAGIFDTVRTEVWTSVHFLPRESFEWLYLWLACRLPNPIMRMEVATAAKDSGLVTPLFPTVTMATAAVDGSLAYLTIRPAETDPDTAGRRYEIGVVGHGETTQKLADQVGAEIASWDQSFRARTVRITIPDVPTPSAPDAGHFLLDRAHHPMAVTWE